MGGKPLPDDDIGRVPIEPGIRPSRSRIGASMAPLRDTQTSLAVVVLAGGVVVVAVDPLDPGLLLDRSVPFLEARR